MDSIDVQLTALLAIPAREPDVAFTNEIGLRICAERELIARLSAERTRTATLLVATVALATGLWLFSRGSIFATVVKAVDVWPVGLAAAAAMMLLWLVTAGAGAMASD